jgi:hypothetical protein
MKESMLDLMTKMMPYMMPVAYAGGVLLLLGIIGFAVWIISGWGSGLLRFSSRLLILLAIFFLACQVAGMILGAEPRINFGDAAKFEFNTQPFWLVALVFLVPAFFMRIFGAMRPTH